MSQRNTINSTKICLLAISLAISCLICPLHGQIRDSFETGSTRWKLWRDDARAKISQPQISYLRPHSGQSSELFQLTASNGSFAYMVYELQPTALIDELTASLWVRAAPSGFRLGLRVTFPNSKHPETGNPVSTVLFGTASRGGGEWSLVEVRSPMRLLGEQQRVLRSQYGPEIDLRGAYVDGIVVDCYTGPGTIQIQFDDLSIEPIIAASMTEPPPSVIAINQDQEEPTTRIARFAERLNDLQGNVPKWIQYQGENLAWLETLGITGIVLDQPPTAEWLREARSSRLKIITPPPAEFRSLDNFKDWERVDGWLLGSALDSSSTEATRELSNQLSALPMTLHRPTIAESMEDFYLFSRTADILAVPVPVATTIESATDASTVLQETSFQIRGRSLGIASLVTQPTEEWLNQVRSAAQFAGSNPEACRFDLLNTRLQILRSLSSGVRGFYYRSESPLDSGAPWETARAESLRHASTEMRILAPWIQAGTLEPASSIIVPGYRISTHRLQNSMLIICLATGANDQICPVSPSPSTMTFRLPSGTSASTVLRLSHGRLEPVQQTANDSTIVVNVTNPGFAEMLVATDDPRIIQFLQQRINSVARDSAEHRLSIVNQVIATAQRVLISEQLPPNTPEWQQIQDAETEKRTAVYALSRNEFSRSIEASERGTILAQRIVRTSWEKANQELPAPQSSAFTCSPLSLPIHWALGRIASGRLWTSLPFETGNFEDFPNMLVRGWTVNRRSEDTIETNVGGALQAGQDGSSALLLTAKSKTGQPISGGYAGSSLRVRGPEVSVPRQSMFRINGYVKPLKAQKNLQCGVLVYENSLGPAFGQLVTSDDTQSDWKRFSLYRMAPEDGNVRVLFELRGEGEFLVDDIEIDYMLLRDGSNQTLVPLEETPSQINAAITPIEIVPQNAERPRSVPIGR
jgi:hypothetical protein